MQGYELSCPQIKKSLKYSIKSELDIQSPPFSISFCGVFQRAGVSTSLI